MQLYYSIPISNAIRGFYCYARNIGKVSIPRVISFCAACYTIGLPPEIIGLSVLSEEDIASVKDAYVNFAFDIKTALSFFNEDVLALLPADVKASLKPDWGDYEVNQEHRAVTSRIIRAIKDKNNAELQRMLVEAAHIRRRFLG